MTLPTVVWNTTLVIGDILTPAGVALAFTTPLQGPVCALGQINYFVLAPPPPDTFQQIVDSEAGVLAIVDEEFNTIPADGWAFSGAPGFYDDNDGKYTVRVAVNGIPRTE